MEKYAHFIISFSSLQKKEQFCHLCTYQTVTRAVFHGGLSAFDINSAHQPCSRL